MPTKNKIIKLNSISRRVVGNQSYIFLDNQQDSLSHVHSLALVNEDGFSNGELYLLKREKVGQFPICFKLKPEITYLVFGIVPKNVITDFTHHGHYSTKDTQELNGTGGNSECYKQLVHEWMANRKDWVQSNGIRLHA